MPVYEWNHSLHTYKVTEIAQALLKSSLTAPKVCHRTPTNVEHNCTFLVNQSKLKSQSDLKVDDCGSWKNDGVRCVIILVNSGKTTVIAREKKVKTYKMENGLYLLTLPIAQVEILGRSSSRFLVTILINIVLYNLLTDNNYYLVATFLKAWGVRL